MNQIFLRETESRRSSSEFPFYVYHMPDYEVDTQLVPPHWHDETELVYSETEGLLYIDNRMYEMHPGDVFIVNPCHIHRTWRVQHGFMAHIVFSPSILLTNFNQNNEVNQLINNMIHQRVVFSENPSQELKASLLPYVRELVYSFGERKIQYGAESCRVYSLLFAIMAEFLEAGAFSEVADNDIYGIEYVTHILSFIQEHYSEPLTADDLAMAGGISKTYLYRLFHDYIGLSPVGYINCYRLRESYRLLSAGLNVTETAYAVGITNTSYFIRIFKEATGMTPLKWIKERRGINR